MRGPKGPDQMAHPSQPPLSRRAGLVATAESRSLTASARAQLSHQTGSKVRGEVRFARSYLNLCCIHRGCDATPRTGRKFCYNVLLSRRLLPFETNKNRDCETELFSPTRILHREIRNWCPVAWACLVCHPSGCQSGSRPRLQCRSGLHAECGVWCGGTEWTCYLLADASSISFATDMRVECMHRRFVTPKD